jgi:hypothetical protein
MRGDGSLEELIHVRFRREQSTGTRRQLAVCDIAVVQGGLSTAMELTANRRPFLYFPLRHHFEQNIHVRHRLNRHRSGRAMDYAADGPDEIAAALAQELYRPLTTYPSIPAAPGARPPC